MSLNLTALGNMPRHVEAHRKKCFLLIHHCNQEGIVKII